MRKIVLAVFCLAILALCLPCPADTSPASLNPASQRVKRMEAKLAARKAKVDEWERQAKEQIYLSVGVGILGLLVSALQGSSNKWTKGSTIVVGFVISAVTLLTNKVYTADYRTLERSAVQARPIVEHLEDIISKPARLRAPDRETLE